jgi:DNA modification methylase
MIYHGDCLDIMPTLADKSVDLTVTSPPYDNLRTYNGNSQFDFEGIAKELFRVTKDGGVVVWIVADATIKGSETGTSFRQALYFKEIGFNLHDTMIWSKGCFTSPQTTRYPNSFEYMFILSKGSASCNQIKDRQNKKAGMASIHTIRKADGKTRNMYSDGRKTTIGEFGVRFNVWNVYPEQSNKKRLHPAPFPEQLATDHILSWSNEGDTILDPFAGSGTTGVACLNTGRKFILIEKDASYCEIIKNRIENHQPLLQAVNV